MVMDKSCFRFNHFRYIKTDIAHHIIPLFRMLTPTFRATITTPSAVGKMFSYVETDLCLNNI